MLLSRAILQIFEITSVGISTILRKSLNLILTANWWILLLLLLTTSAWPCLQHSRNLGTTFYPSGSRHSAAPRADLLQPAVSQGLPRDLLTRTNRHTAVPIRLLSRYTHDLLRDNMNCTVKVSYVRCHLSCDCDTLLLIKKFNFVVTCNII